MFKSDVKPKQTYIYHFLLCQLVKYRGRLSKSEEQAIAHKSQLLQQQITQQQEKIKQGGINALKGEHSHCMVIRVSMC